MGVKPTNYKKHLKSDILAGITVSLILIPQSLAYAQLAGLPPHYGLYASILPPIMAAIFGSSKHLATGPVAILSLMTAASISQYYTPGTIDYITLAVFLAFCFGLFQILLSFIKLGSAINLLSHPVLYGFTNAAALIIASTQIPKFLNIKIAEHTYTYQTMIEIIQRLISDTDLNVFMLGLWSVLSITMLKLINKKLPAILIVVLIATFYSWVSSYNGPVVGNIPSSLPFPSLPKLNLYMLFELAPTILIMGIIGFTEAISVAQTIAIKTNSRIDPNKELFGQGIANLFGSLFQSYPVSGSFTRTAVNFQSGARTAVSSIITGLIVLVVLLFFTQFIYFLPEVVLAAVIITSVGSLIDIKRLLHIWKTSRHDAVAALITFVVTLYYAPHLDKGLTAGVFFSLGYYLYKNIHPRVVFLSKYKDGWFHDAQKFNLKRCSNIAAVRLDSQLFFANSSYIENVIINDLVNHPDITDVLLMANGVNGIDSTGEHMLYSLWKTLKKNGITLHISSLKSQITEVLDRTGLKTDIGINNFHPTLDEAVASIINDMEKSKKHTDSLSCPLKQFIKIEELENASATNNYLVFGNMYKKALLRLNRF